LALATKKLVKIPFAPSNADTNT